MDIKTVIPLGSRMVTILVLMQANQMGIIMALSRDSTLVLNLVMDMGIQTVITVMLPYIKNPDVS